MSQFAHNDWNDSLRNLSEGINKAQAPSAPTQDGKRSRRRMINGALLIGAGWLLQRGPRLRDVSVDFFTDFTEKDPLVFWKGPAESHLDIQQYAGRMSAKPVGPSILRPSEGMSNGRMSTHFVVSREPAEFILRGHTLEDCYVLGLSQRLAARKPELELSVKKVRRGHSRIISHVTISDVQLAQLAGQRLAIEMDGRNFAAWLEWEAESRPAVWDVSEVKAKLVHAWKDDSYRDGPVGLWGANPQVRKPFRVFSVRVHG